MGFNRHALFSLVVLASIFIAAPAVETQPRVPETGEPHWVMAKVAEPPGVLPDEAAQQVLEANLWDAWKVNLRLAALHPKGWKDDLKIAEAALKDCKFDLYETLMLVLREKMKPAEDYFDKGHNPFSVAEEYNTYFDVGANMDESNYEFQSLKHFILAIELLERDMRKKCKEADKPTTQISFDSTVWCTYGEGTSFPITLIPTGEDGEPIGEPTASGEKPKEPTEGTCVPCPEGTTTGLTCEPCPEGTISSPTEATTAEKPKEKKTPPEKEKKTPPEVTTPVTVTIIIKAKKAVLEGGSGGDELVGMVVRLDPVTEPDLPKTATADADDGWVSAAADAAVAQGEALRRQNALQADPRILEPGPFLPDNGSDQDPKQCTTGLLGECSVEVPGDQAVIYFPDNEYNAEGYVVAANGGQSPAKIYHLSVDVPLNNGGYVKITDTGQPIARGDPPPGVTINEEVVKFGNSTFVRFAVQGPYDAEDFPEWIRELYGPGVKIDICVDKLPGPPLGMQPVSFSALNRELPEATVNFSPVARPRSPDMRARQP